MTSDDYKPQLDMIAKALDTEIADPELLIFLRKAFNDEGLLDPTKLSDQERNAVIIFGMETFQTEELKVIYSAAFHAGLIWGRRRN